MEIKSDIFGCQEVILECSQFHSMTIYYLFIVLVFLAFSLSPIYSYLFFERIQQSFGILLFTTIFLEIGISEMNTLNFFI